MKLSLILIGWEHYYTSRDKIRVGMDLSTWIIFIWINPEKTNFIQNKLEENFKKVKIDVFIWFYTPSGRISLIILSGEYSNPECMRSEDVTLSSSPDLMSAECDPGQVMITEICHTLPIDQWEDRDPDNWPIRASPRIIIVSSQLLMIILSIKYLGILGWQYAIGPVSPSCKDQNSLYLCHPSSWLGITRGARCSREIQRIQEDFKCQ